MSEKVFSLTKEQMPDCWSNDVRMTALFAPFRLKSVNPTDYESKMKFWKELIAKWSQKQGSFSYEDLRSAFQRNGKYPACLEAVMEDMLSSGSICPSSSIQATPGSWLGWGASQVIRPLSWASRALLGAKGPPFDKQKTYVHLDSLKTQSLLFLASLPDEAKIGSPSELWAASTATSPREAAGDSLELMLTWLRSQNLATCTHDGKVYKLALDATTRVRPLTEGEICLPRLEKALRTLESSIDKMQEKSQSMREAAKQCLRKGDKNAALAQLRQKKLLETRLERAMSSHDSISHLIDTVRQAHSDSEIFDAFRTGLGALKVTMKQTGLEEDNVLDTMDEIKDSLDVYSDIESALSQPMGMTFDKDELEAELLDLVASGGDYGSPGGGKIPEESNKTGDKEMFTSLPTVPSSPLDSTQGDKKFAMPIPPPSVEDNEDFHQVMERRLKNLRLAEKS